MIVKTETRSKNSATVVTVSRSPPDGSLTEEDGARRQRDDVRKEPNPWFADAGAVGTRRPAGRLMGSLMVRGCYSVASPPFTRIVWPVIH
jgi:hypothetical protein